MRSAGFIEFVDVFHQGGDGGVELVLMNIGSNFLNCEIASSNAFVSGRFVAPVVTGLLASSAPVVADAPQRIVRVHFLVIKA